MATTSDDASRSAQFQCPVCGSGRYDRLWPRDDLGATPVIRWFSCSACGFAFSKPELYSPRAQGSFGSKA